MLLALERRADAISGEFNSRDVANTLWAIATMGAKPGERMMGQLKRRAEAISGEFNTQDVANTLFYLHSLLVGHFDFLSTLVSVASRLGSDFFAGLNAATLAGGELAAARQHLCSQRRSWAGM